MSASPVNAIFRRAGNSCRGIMAQCLLDAPGGGGFKGHIEAAARALVALPVETLDATTPKRKLAAIGMAGGP